MSDAWTNTAKKTKEHVDNAGGKFIRLPKDGDKIVGAFCGEPFSREVVWTGNKCEAYDPAKHTGNPSLRVLLNFYVPEHRAMRIFEGSATWFKSVMTVRDKYGLENWLFEIKRHGTGLDTEYTILPETKLTPEQAEEISKMQLNDLERMTKGNGNNAGDGDNADVTNSGGDDGFIDEDTKLKIGGRLRMLPKKDWMHFLEQFRIDRVGALRESEVNDAFELLGKLESQNQPSQPAEVDPFA